MDSIVHAALEEICAQGTKGLPLQSLWPKLNPSVSSHNLSLCPDVKRALWANIIDIPGLQFESSRGVNYDSSSDSIRALEECEKMGVKIIAPERLRDCFIGIYDVKASDITQVQRRTLERLAIARTNGITQSELAKEFGIKGNNIFYILKKLESRGLIVRQSTVIRTKEASKDREPRNTSIVSTNMLHLYRYAKHLGCQQRLEINKEDKHSVGGGIAEGVAESEDGIAKEFAKEDVLVKDFLPALKAICDKLEKAEAKVLVVSDIKRDLGYRGTSGHRAWRNICHKLKDARVVEEFCAKVNDKEVNCLRLLKKFSPQHFEPKSRADGSSDFDTEQPLKLGKRGQLTEQILELPIEHQIYDMIDAAGSKGLTITEVCKRLGIRNKQYYNRLLNMFSRFGMHLQAEGHNRGVAYRVWTSRNYNPEASDIVPGETQMVLHENTDCNPHMVDLEFHENSAQTVHDIDASACKDDIVRATGENGNFDPFEPQTVSLGSIERNPHELDLVDPEDSAHTIQEIDALVSKDDSGAIQENENIAIEADGSGGSTADKESTSMPFCHSNSQNLACEPSDRVADVDLPIVSTTASSTALVESPPAISTPRRRRSYQRYPCLTLGAASEQRKQRILKMLQEEKFLIKPELHRRLESLEKEKNTMMDRKTLERSLNKLQQEGHCKCIHVSVPVVTNCGRSRTTEVVLHPSVYNVSPEILGQIHERMRSFEMQVRRQSFSRPKKGQEVPILDNIQRIANDIKSDVQAEMAEVRRANGYVLAKMVRTKLLHIFLWGYISSLPGWDDALSFGRHGYDVKSPHSTFKLFELDTALKAMPVELFLQVVGSTQRFDDMVEKCRNGLCLSDLPVDEYRHLMDTRATARLSRLIDILRRLKLIRLVSGGGVEDATRTPHTTLTHSLELKPYMEEPVSIVASSLGFFSPDLRPQIRHDFVLSSRKAVDEYWNTLEYCYSAADPKAALHAFPGSVVHEVFSPRSWASVRLMTAEQRAELLKRIVTEDPNKKLTFKECEKIARGLNLTLEQVLRVYYDKRNQRLTRIQGVYTKNQDIQQPESANASSSRKRKRSSDRKCSKHVKADSVDGQSCEHRLNRSSTTADQFEEEDYATLPPEDLDCNSQKDLLDDNMEAEEEAELNEEEGDQGFIHKCALSRLKPKRQRKFSWTETADRQLVIEYVRHRAALGANFHRAYWTSLQNLPAPPETCRRRMAMLNSGVQFRKALMRLCNILTDRYAKCLEKFQKKSLDTSDHRMMVRNYAFEECDQDISDDFENSEDFDHIKCWDNFDDPDIKTALDDVLRYKKSAKLEDSKGVDFDTQGSKSNSSAPSQKVGQRSSSNRLPPRYIKFLNEGISVDRRAYESVAVSNAIELFKLIFLSKSTAPEVPTLLAETLRRYSEHDLFVAFNYLREKKIMIGGSSTSPFVLSQHFLQSISLSPFPINTGKRAAKFTSWLHEREKDLMEDGVDLPADLQCGDVFHLCALISLGELSITPCLPDEGVGEAEDTRTSKRKIDSVELCGSEKSKKLRSSLAGEGEIISRREKGFPGIKLHLSRAKISRMDALELSKDQDVRVMHFEHNQVTTVSGPGDGGILSNPNERNSVVEVGESGGSIHTKVPSVESPWEAMTHYAQNLLSSCSYQETGSSFNPELFRNVCSAIQKAGDQGLSTTGVSKIMNIQGERMLGIVIEVLEAFGRALKVNAYDSVHVVDPLYRSKYFLTSVAGLHQDPTMAPLRGSKEKYEVKQQIPDMGNHEAGVETRKEMSTNAHEEHKVTILNLPEEVAELSGEIQSIDKMDDSTHPIGNSERENSGGEVLKNSGGEVLTLHSRYSHSCRPILPWINGDGTTNDLVYKGLIRRILGIIMQNPGILEEDIIAQMPVLNRQNCRKLLEMMILDSHITVRKMPQNTSAEPPAILSSLIGSRFKKSTFICREHFFANPMTTILL